MLIGGDDVSNDVITLGTCFSMFVYIRTRFRFTLIGGNLTAQSTGCDRGIGGGIQISGRNVAARATRRACSQVGNIGCTAVITQTPEVSSSGERCIFPTQRNKSAEIKLAFIPDLNTPQHG